MLLFIVYHLFFGTTCKDNIKDNIKRQHKKSYLRAVFMRARTRKKP